MIKKEAEKILKYKNLILEIQRMWKLEAKLKPVIIGGDWKHHKITQTIPKQRTGKARNEGTAKSSHIGHWTHTTESANIKVHNIRHGRNNITCRANCKYRTAATLYTLEGRFVSGI